MEKQEYTIRCGVVDVLPYNILIGHGTLYDLCIDWKPWDEYIAIGGEKVKAYTAKDLIYSTSESYVYLSENVTIPPLSQMIISEKSLSPWNSNFDALMEPLPAILHALSSIAQLFVSAAIVQPDKGEIPIKVANLSTHPIKLVQNEPITWLTSDFIVKGSFDLDSNSTQSSVDD